ncbi:hypothetical protein [Streptomyces sp. R33]|uniref:Uncharacterized protein n=1 Tax=Streptomyces sp. R33 TaxID=3238629 RepID=A0AB39XUK0_9ACTN
MGQPYRPAVRGWIKVRRRDTSEAIIGAITGTLARPQLLVLGRHDPAGRLRAVGRTVPLRPEQARQVGEHLAATDPGHPWDGVRFTSTWGSRDVLDVVLVRPELVAEVSADRAVDRGGVFRHPSGPSGTVSAELQVSASSCVTSGGFPWFLPEP